MTSVDCQFGGKPAFFCSEPKCPHPKHVCSNLSCKCRCFHQHCELISNSNLLSLLFEQEDPSIRRYSDAITILSQKRVSHISQVYRKFNLPHFSANSLDHQTMSQLQPGTFFENVPAEKIQMLLEERRMGRLGGEWFPNYKVEESLEGLIRNIEEKGEQKKSLTQGKKQSGVDIQEEYEKTLLLLEKPSKMRIGNQYVNDLPSRSRCLQVTELSFESFSLKASCLLPTRFPNLKRLAIGTLREPYQPIYGSNYYINDLSGDKESKDFRIIREISKIECLEDLNIQNFNNISSDQYTRMWTLFPNIKTLRINTQFVNSYSIVQILNAKPDTESMFIAFFKSGIGNPLVCNLALKFMNNAASNLKSLTLTQPVLDENYADALSQFTNLQELSLCNESIEESLFLNTFNTGFNYFEMADPLNNKADIKEQKKLITLTKNMKNLRKLHFTLFRVSSTTLESITCSSPLIQNLQVQTFFNLDTQFFDALILFQNLKRLYLLSFILSEECWETLSKATFKLSCFYLVEYCQPPIYGATRTEQQRLGNLSPSFFQNQPLLQELRTKSHANNRLCYNLHKLAKLRHLQFCCENILTRERVTNSGYLYLSKLRNLNAFQVNGISTIPISQTSSFMRLVWNNPDVKLKDIEVSNMDYKMQRNMFVMKKTSRCPEYEVKNPYRANNNFNFNFGGPY